jgi:hypothetical protein
VILIGLLLVIAFALSRPVTKRALPLESLLAFGTLGVACVVLFQIGRLS